MRRFLCLMLLFAVPSSGATETVRAVLPNGLRILLQTEPGQPLVHLEARGLGGVLLESADKSGVNNMMARMLLCGAGKRSRRQIFGQVEKLRGRLLASGGDDTFGLALELPASGLEEGLALLADCLRRPTFPTEELPRQRARVLAAIAERGRSPWPTSARLYRATMFAGHPYARSPLGTRRSVIRLLRPDVVTAWRRLCTPKNLVFTVSGDFDGKRMLAALRSRLSDWKGPAAPEPARPPMPSRAARALRTQRDARFSQSVARIGFPTVGRDHPDRVALEALARVLGQRGEALRRDRRDRGRLVDALGVHADCGLAGGSFELYLGATPDRLERAVKGLWEIVARARQGVTKAELRWARQALLRERTAAAARSAEKAALDWLRGAGPRAERELLSRIEALSAAQLQRVARQYLVRERSVTALVGPRVGPTPEQKTGPVLPAADPQATPASALALTVRLLEAGKHRELIERLMRPDQKADVLKQVTLDELVAAFARRKAAALLIALKQVQRTKPRIDKAGLRAYFRTEDGEDVTFSKVGKRWYLDN